MSCFKTSTSHSFSIIIVTQNSLKCHEILFSDLWLGSVFGPCECNQRPQWETTQLQILQPSSITSFWIHFLRFFWHDTVKAGVLERLLYSPISVGPVFCVTVFLSEVNSLKTSALSKPLKHRVIYFREKGDVAAQCSTKSG